MTAGLTYTLPVKLSVASTGETVEVTADSLALDKVTDTQSTVLPETAVENLPNSGRDYTQLIGQTTGYAGLSTGGGGYNFSENGSRSNGVNWQIEGTDNNDLWWNIPAVNQTGVNGMAGVILPIDAVENFTFLAAGTTELGRNPGGTANLTIKAGTNQLHGTAYYFNENEFFQVTNPFATTKPETRNQHYGFSVGGPIVKDKAFFFVAGEHQGFLLGALNKATEPSAAYRAEADALLTTYNVPQNPVAHNLLYGNGSIPGLWPSSALTGPASPDNYTATGNAIGHSFNGIVKLDERLTDKDHLAATWFIGQGSQTAPTSSALAPYFEIAPIHVQNYSLVYNRTISPFISNQLSAGVSYFSQTFSDADVSFNPIGLGLDTGVTSPGLAGSPHIVIGPSSASSGLFGGGSGGFDPIGVTTPSGRTDITGHLDDDLTWTKGAHQLHFGGEFRRARVDDFYQTGQRGTLYFDGTQGLWSSSKPSDPNILYLADFLAGYYDPSQTQIVLGDPKRLVFVNTFSFYGQDTWQIRRRLSLNYGVRYDYEGPVHSASSDLSVFDPSLPSGLAVAGENVPDIYGKFWGGINPRVGFAYQLSETTVLRGGYGIYEDSIFMKSILQNNGAQNISVFGPGQNPAGSNEVAQAGGLSVPAGGIQSGHPIFETYNQALAGAGIVKISTFAKNFRPSATQSYDLNLQHSFTNSVVWQLGYVGTQATHLLGLFDINPGALGSLNTPVPYTSTTCAPQYSGATPTTPGNDLQCSRPYFSQFPNFSVIDEAESNLESKYNSLQSSLRIQGFHGLTSQFGYTWSHALDYETGLLPYVPQDPLNEHAEYGNSDFDVRNTFTGYVHYQVPSFRGPNRLSRGWELDSGFSFHGGTPYTVVSATNPSGNGEGADRAVQVVSNPSAGVSHAVTNGVVQWFSPTAFVDAPLNTYSPTRRGQNYNPGYSDVDLAVLKNTLITESVSAQFRVDIFNVFNHTNLAPVGLPFAAENGTIGSTLGPYLGNPSIGPGEPLHAEFSLRILF